MESGDRVRDWQDELRHVGPRLHELPEAARRAVLEVVAAFLSEDAGRLRAEAVAPLPGEWRAYAQSV